MFAAKLAEQIPDPSNAKEYYSYLKRIITKLVKRSKLITQQPKTFENPNVLEIKSVTIEHPKISCKLSKTIRQAVKVSQADFGKKF